MKLFVWADHHSFQVTVHAETVDRTRVLALREIGTTDGSCPNRERVRQHVIAQGPSIWIGENADYVIEETKTETDERIAFFS